MGLENLCEMTVRHWSRTGPSDHADCHQFDIDLRHFEVTSVNSTAAPNANLQLRSGDATSFSNKVAKLTAVVGAALGASHVRADVGAAIPRSRWSSTAKRLFSRSPGLSLSETHL